MQKMFKNEIFGEIEPPDNSGVNLIGAALPKNQDLYFISKWYELIDRYSTARMFLNKTNENNWDYWFNPQNDKEIQKALIAKFKSDLYETALINYNIIVDLSWTITYVSAEYALYSFDKDNNITNADNICGMHPIEESYESLRKIENGVLSPHTKGNQFEYLKKISPEFSDSIDIVVEFWKSFSNSNIRNLYNFIKHKGKPLYKETKKIRKEKIYSILIGKENYPSDIGDVQKIISLEGGINELIEFDNSSLYPYIKKLLEALNKAVNPSPWI